MYSGSDTNFLKMYQLYVLNIFITLLLDYKKKISK